MSKKAGKAKKAAIMQAVMAAHEAGMQKGASMAAQPQGGPPPGGMPPPGAPPAPGMKFGGKVEKAEGESKAADKKEGKKGEAKEKWVPPWAKKAGGGAVKAFAAGGVVARGDGIAARGRTRCRMR